MPNLVILSEEEIESIKKDYESGLTERQLQAKYQISRNKIRRLLGINTDAAVMTKEERERKKRELRRKKRLNAAKRIEEAEVHIYNQIIKDEYIDLFEGIRQSIEDMLELNEEQRRVVPELIETMAYLREQIDKKTSIDDPIRNDMYKAIELISNFWGSGKLRIDSRKELGAWFDRYEKLKMTTLQFKYFEKIINALFEGINLLSVYDYTRVRNAAVGVFSPVERYFDQNEQQTGGEPNDEQEQKSLPERGW